MLYMAGPAPRWSPRPLSLHSGTQALGVTLFLMTLFLMDSTLGRTILLDGPPLPPPLPKYLRCYRCLLETKELGCLLGSDICLAPLGSSSCVTLHIKNSSGPDVMVSDCRSGEQLSDCSHTQASPVFGFWIFYQCCFMNFCNSPKNRRVMMH
ncbi:lymphocyte antigen 6 complex locus protein G5c [Acomys russatus]|uniref:lymphocyte antigen 6 complex locus protein G5c n=1 Tax=Acomys russatus TaxID=60746 RepID=UPI0021E30D84|nr:lymphocyte antigen 6 complex locus protein G5c [Acomys russatus]